MCVCELFLKNLEIGGQFSKGEVFLGELILNLGELLECTLFLEAFFQEEVLHAHQLVF